MKNYTKKDFSPIFGTNENPSKPGWYVNVMLKQSAKWLHGHPDWIIPPFDILKWSGRNWYFVDGIKASKYRQGFWFGLNYNPKKK